MIAQPGFGSYFFLLKALTLRSGLIDDRRAPSGRRSLALISPAVLLIGLAGCQSVGPTRKAIEKAAAQPTVSGLHIVDVTNDVARQLSLDIAQDKNVFARDLSGAEAVGSKASPPALFGTSNLDTGIGAVVQGSRPNVFPGFMVGPGGTITIPFAGAVPAAGRTTHQIEQEIVRRLQRRAHLPQAIVRISRNVAAAVTVLGELTPHGERVLEALSNAGGTSQPLDHLTIQLTRGSTVRRMAAEDIIADPRNDVVLRPGDVVTAIFQPYSFTVLGAAGKNEEIRFEATGITLSQALGRVGGVRSDTADPKGVFIFRWQKPTSVGVSSEPASTGTGVPVIYRVDLKQPETYLASQRFAMRDGDVLYVSNSPMADFQRFVGLVASSIIPISTARSIAP
jgi:polysaccharide export outer membrane protein